MARKHFSTEQIIGMLRESEVRLSQGQTIGIEPEDKACPWCGSAMHGWGKIVPSGWTSFRLSSR
jgi:hypothetical protein